MNEKGDVMAFYIKIFRHVEKSINYISIFFFVAAIGRQISSTVSGIAKSICTIWP